MSQNLHKVVKETVYNSLIIYKPRYIIKSLYNRSMKESVDNVYNR